MSSPSSPGVCPVVNTHTTCMCGVFTVKVGAKILAVVTILDGLMSVLTWLNDYRNPDDVMFRWGKRGWETALQTVNTVLGIASILGGSAALRCCERLDLRGLRRWRTYVLIVVGWTICWSLCVGLPTDIVFESEPVIQVWPLSTVPGVPRQDVVSPRWPTGRPSVCTDVHDAKQTLVRQLTEHRSSAVGAVLFKVFSRVARRIVTCRQVQQVFWSFILLSLTWRGYAMYLILYFEKVISHGGDGKMMIGRLSDLDKPVTTSTRDLIEKHLEDLFDRMDKDNDGKVSLSELKSYFKNNSSLYRRHLVADSSA